MLVLDPSEILTTSADASTPATTLQAPDPRRLALAVLAGAQLKIVLDASILDIALPSAQQELGISVRTGRG